MALKLAIFGLWNTTIFKGNISEHNQLYSQLQSLVNFLLDKNVKPIILSNRSAKVTSGISIEKSLSQLYPKIETLITSNLNLPKKPSKKIIDYVLQKYNVENNETILIGNSVTDFQTAVNGQILYLNSCWKESEVDYGFKFESPFEIQRFVDLFCLNSHYWHFKYDKEFNYYSLAPFSTYNPNYEFYSQSARSAAKENSNRKDFFLKYLVASIYFSGLYKEFNYIASYPRHIKGYGSPVMDSHLKILGNFFKKKYIPDLLIRHTPAIKSQTARIKKLRINFVLNQLNTIKLNSTPHKSDSQTYKNFATTIKDKVILVIDDFVTDGCSLSAANAYLREAGATTIGLSWLKTINSPYGHIEIKDNFNPFSDNHFSKNQYKLRVVPYGSLVNDKASADELKIKFRNYLKYNI